MTLTIILLIAYTIGINVCYWMLKVDHESEGQPWTLGDAALAVLCSLLSWVCVMWVLIGAWVGKIAESGYWRKPLSPTKQLPE